MLTLSLILGSAPAFMRASTMEILPITAASIRAVVPFYVNNIHHRYRAYRREGESKVRISTMQRLRITNYID